MIRFFKNPTQNNANRGFEATILKEISYQTFVNFGENLKNFGTFFQIVDKISEKIQKNI